MVLKFEANFVCVLKIQSLFGFLKTLLIRRDLKTTGNLPTYYSEVNRRGVDTSKLPLFPVSQMSMHFLLLLK